MSASRKAASVVSDFACELQALVSGFHRAERENSRLRRLLREGLEFAEQAAKNPQKAEAFKQWKSEVTSELTGTSW